MVSLSKVSLTKSGEKVSLSKSKIDLSKGAATDFMINLNWNTGVEKKEAPTGFLASVGALFSGDQGIDLDLGCFFELRNGTAFSNFMGMGGVDKWCIDGLQFSKDKSKQGSLTKAPWIYHLGDDRSGSSDAGEFIKVNLDECHNIKRMCVYAFIYEGVPSWDKTDAVVTVSVPGQAPIEVAMGNQSRSESFCVIASLEFSEEGSITVTRHMSFHANGHEGADNTYGWGMRWGAGRK